MDRSLAEQTSTNRIELFYIDIDKLVKTMDSRFVGQEISLSEYVPLKVSWYHSFTAGLNERKIETRGRHELTQTIDSYLFGDKDIHLGRILLERGVLPEDDGDYERIALRTFRPVMLIGSSAVIPPTTVDIIIMGIEEDYSTRCILNRTDKHSSLRDLLKTEWFLTHYAIESIKESEE